jgi:predicted phosphodiesterase
MEQIISKRRLRFWFKLILMILLLGGGITGGYKLHELGSKVGCFQLPENVVPINIKLLNSDTIRFIALGDTGTGDEEQHKVANGMAQVCKSSGCDMVLMLGDNFYDDGLKSYMDTQFESKFVNVYNEINKPFFAVLGNHDIRWDALSQVMHSIDSDKWRMPNYEYSFKTETARFFGINTSCPFSSERLRNYLDIDDSEYAKDEAARPWTIAFGHHSVFSNGTHGDTDFFTRLYWDWFLEGRVDLYLSGHNHHLAHLQHGNIPTEYVVSGAGAKHYRSASERERLNKSEALSKFTYNDTGFVWIEISSHKLYFSMHDSDGNVLYEYTKTR